MTTVAIMRSLDALEKEWLRKKTPKFDVGDTVEVHVKIIEGDRERIQLFSGIVIARRHQGLSETFTVRRIVQGEGVERVFPIHSPRVVDVKVKKKGGNRLEFVNLREEGFPLNVNPEHVSAADAPLQDGDMVMGIVLGGEARAYPVNYMGGPTNEVVNDTLGGQAIAPSW